MLKPSLHTQNLGQVQVQGPEQPTTKQRQRRCQKVTFAKRKEKNRQGRGGGGYPMEWKRKCTIQSPYLQTNRKYKHYCIWNQSKHQEELNSDIASVIHVFSNKIGHLLKINKGSLKKWVIDWFPSNGLQLILLSFLIRGCSITFFLYIFYWFCRISTIARFRSSGWFRINIHVWFYQRLVLKVP